MANKDAGATATTNGTSGVAAVTDALEAMTVQELGRKVFVGNLNFVTKEEQLREVFSKHGEISEVQIIHRGTRSLGYGFVTFATVEEAQKAVAATDKIEIDGRAINAEIAKPAPGTPGGAVPRSAARAAKASKATSAGQTNGDHKASDDDKENHTDNPSLTSSKPRRKGRSGRGRTRRFGRGRRPSGEAKPETNGEDHGATTDTSAHPDTDAANKPRPKRTRSRRGRRPSRGDATDGADGAPKRERRPRRTGPPTGDPSKTLLFVANLAFSVTDEALKEAFSGYQVTSAHIVHRRYGSTVGRSKGFGFVEFENEENQLKALQELQGKELEGRPLLLKIAVNEAKKEAEEAAEKSEGDAAANTASA